MGAPAIRRADPQFADILISNRELQIQILQKRVGELGIAPTIETLNALRGEANALARERLFGEERQAVNQILIRLHEIEPRFSWIKSASNLLLRILELVRRFLQGIFPSFFAQKQSVQTRKQKIAGFAESGSPLLGTFYGKLTSSLLNQPQSTRLFCALSGLRGLWEQLEENRVLKEGGKFLDEVIEKRAHYLEPLDLEQIWRQFPELERDEESWKELHGLSLQRQIQQLSNKQRLTGAIWSIPGKVDAPLFFILIDGRESPGVFYFGFLELPNGPCIKIASSYQAVWDVLKKQLRAGEQSLLIPVLKR